MAVLRSEVPSRLLAATRSIRTESGLSGRSNLKDMPTGPHRRPGLKTPS